MTGHAGRGAWHGEDGERMCHGTGHGAVCFSAHVDDPACPEASSSGAFDTGARLPRKPQPARALRGDAPVGWGMELHLCKAKA